MKCSHRLDGECMLVELDGDCADCGVPDNEKALESCHAEIIRLNKIIEAMASEIPTDLMGYCQSIECSDYEYSCTRCKVARFSRMVEEI